MIVLLFVILSILSWASSAPLYRPQLPKQSPLTFLSPFSPLSAPSSPSSSPSSSSSSSAVTCGLGNIDLSSLSSTGDWLGLASDYTEIYYLSLCSPAGVANLWCALNDNTRNATFCQVDPGNPASTFKIIQPSATGDSPLFVWSWFNGKNSSDGILLTSKSGDTCPNRQPRTGVIHFVCLGKNSTYNAGLPSYTSSAPLPTNNMLGEVVEATQCVYNTTAATPLLCNKDTTTFYEPDQEYVKKVQEIKMQQNQASMTRKQKY